MIRWKKGERRILARDPITMLCIFNTSEFECPCNYSECVDQILDNSLLNKLTAARAKAGSHPIKITSGYRCTKYQADLKKRGFNTSKKTSQHVLGKAVDIDLQSHPKKDTLVSVLKELFKAIGLGEVFIHVDERSDRERYWEY